MKGKSKVRSSINKALRWVVVLNLAGFAGEVVIAISIASVALLADSIDFLEDASLNVLVLVGLGWSALWRRRLGFALAVVLVMPALAAAALIAMRLSQLFGWSGDGGSVVAPQATLLTLAGMGALAINLIATLLLLRLRHQGGSLVRAAYLSARNDVLGNIAIIAAGLATALTASVWPDVIVGLFILAVNGDAARDVIKVARQETDASVNAPTSLE